MCRRAHIWWAGSQGDHCDSRNTCDHVVQPRRFETCPQVKVTGQNAQHVEGTHRLTELASLAQLATTA